MAKGFDTATKLTAEKARALKQAGFEYALRYLGNTWKGFNKAEAKAIQDAGLKLVSIFQKSANYAGYFSKEQGIRDAKQAQEWAEDVGQPEGTAIYFAVDFDAQGAHLKNVLAYVEGLKSTLKKYKIGLYGSYTVMQAVKGKVDYYWQTYAWSKGKVADFIHMHQYQNGVKVAGVMIDRDEIKKSPGAWNEAKKEAPKKAPAKETKTPAKEEYTTYTIKKGDTFWDLEEKHGWKHGTLQKLNPGVVPEKLQIGQKIKIPKTATKAPASKTSATKTKSYTIKKGDTFWDLEEKFGWPHGTLQKLNPTADPKKLQVGQKIKVPK